MGQRSVAFVRFGGRVDNPPPFELAVDRLAEVMRATWLAEANARGIAQPAPAMVRWRWAPEDVGASLSEINSYSVPGITPPAISGPVDPSRRSGLLGTGVVLRLHNEVYSQLRHGRLVLVGDAGAGKTGAMILLLLAALDHRVAREASHDVPVPVWLTLGGWDPSAIPLVQWAKVVILRDHPYLAARNYGRDAVDKMLENGRVALFLDGLDELPAAARGAALQRLDQESTALRIVLTSRGNEYRQALTEGRLHNAAVIEVRPIRPRTAARYLVTDQIPPQRGYWEQVGSYIQSHPDSGAAEALNNPLTLSLARATYRNGNPSEIIDSQRFPTAAALRTHLVDRVLVDAYPDSRQRDHARQWLSWIAHHLGTDRDIAWWRIPSWIPNWRLSVSTALAAVLAGLVTGILCVVAVFIIPTNGTSAPSDNDGGLLRTLHIPSTAKEWAIDYALQVGAISGFLIWLGARLLARRASGRSKEPLRLRPRWPRRSEVPRLALVVCATALVVGIAAGVAAALGPALPALSRARVDGLAVELADVGGLLRPLTGLVAVGVALGAPAGILFGLYDVWSVPAERTAASSPTSIYRDDRRASTWVSVAGGLLIGLAVALAAGVTFGVVTAVLFGLLVAVEFAVVGRLTFGSASSVESAQRALRRPAGRVRFERLLESALRRQVLRQAGSVYQFRHAELQDRLATQYQPALDLHPTEASFVVRKLAGTRGGRALGAVTGAAVLLTAVLMLGPVLIPMIKPGHTTLTNTHGRAMTFSPDGRLIAITSPGQTEVRDLGAGYQIINRFYGEAVGQDNRSYALNGAVGPPFNSNGRILATADTGAVYWWDLSTGKHIRTLRVESDAEDFVFSPDGGSLATMSRATRTLRLRDTPTGRNVRSLHAWPEIGPDVDPDDVSVTFSFSPNGRLLATGGDGPVRIWAVATGRQIPTATGNPILGGGDLPFSPDGRTLATDDGEKVRLWDVSTGENIGILPVAGVEHILFSPDGEKILTTQHGSGGFKNQELVDGRIDVWDVVTGSHTATLAAEGKWVTSILALSSDGKTLAAGLNNSGQWNEFNIGLWDLRDGTNIATLEAGDGYLWNLAISPDGQTLVSGWGDDRVRLWELSEYLRE